MKKGMLAGISIVAGFAGGAAMARMGRKWLRCDTDKESVKLFF